MSDELTFALLRRLSHTHEYAREALARSLSAADATLDAALAKASALGVTILAAPQRGYRLSEPIDWLNPHAVASELGALGGHLDLRIVDSIGSTNTALMEQAAALESGTVLAAELQTAGRGRRGRAWHTGIGGALTFSVLWRFEQGAGVLAGLSPAIGIALCRGMRELGIEAQLKWPNDVLVQHQKIAGTLVEIQGEVLGPSVAVIGIGVNCRLAAVTRDRIDQAVTDLVSVGVRESRNRVLASLLKSLLAVLSELAAAGFGSLRTEWEALHVYAGKPVSVRLPDGSTEPGIAAGIGEDGTLLLQTASGLRRYHSGEVSLRPAPSAAARSAQGR
jgi:BirA family transcriptional regulator, biotin operon repressor / biotin---[acetyl-CoA-carboxylase] ligase